MISTPTLILDENRCRANIRSMVSKARTSGSELRPHFKTHQSLEIGRWFKESGVSKITVSSVGMAKYFSEEWDDITIAFPVNIREINEINALANSITLNLLVESEDTVDYLEEDLQNSVNIFIKINLGNSRAGLLPHDRDSIEALAKRINQADNLNLKGFLGHAGQTYSCRDPKQIEAVHQEAKSKLVKLTQSFLLDYPWIIASYGDTPSSSVCKDFEGVAEIRPGNFVFYDLMQVQIGACDSSQIAVAMACPVVSIHPWNFEIVIYGGGIHFSKDRMESDHGSVFGKIIRFSPDGFGTVIPDCYVRNLSQEHGIIKASEEMINQTKIGDLLYVLPVHSCMTANLMKQYLTTDGRTIEMFNPF